MTEMSQTEDRSESKMEVISDGDCGIVGTRNGAGGWLTEYPIYNMLVANDGVNRKDGECGEERKYKV